MPKLTPNASPIHLTIAAIVLTLGSVSQHLLAQDPNSSRSHYRSKRMADGKQWTTRNLDIPVTPSFCYNDSDSNCRHYGRLYPWDSARRVCQVLGAKWRLPTDAEWRNLAKHYGGVSSDSPDKGKAAWQALFKGGDSGFNAVLGGGRTEGALFARLEAHGFYWTASEAGARSAVFYNFGAGGQALHRQDSGEKEQAFSVRCIAD